MSAASPAHAGLAELLTWHVPLPDSDAGRAYAAARATAVAEAQNALPDSSPEHRALTVLTGSKQASATALDACLTALTGPTEGASGDLDPLAHAALLQRFALAVLEAPASRTGGRRARAFHPDHAYSAIQRALDLVDREVQILNEEASAPVTLPPAVFSELTITFVRAALASGDQAAARGAADALEERIGEISEPHLQHHAYTSLAVARIFDGRGDDALVPAQRARSLARRSGDLEGVWRAERIRAHAASLAGRLQMEEAAHREVAALARRLADDLATAPATRSEAALSELESRAVLTRVALTHGRFPMAEDHASGMIDRVTKSREAGDADPARLWEFEIDARVARMLVAGLTESASGGRRRSTPAGDASGRRRAPHRADDTGALTREERFSLYRLRRTETLEAIARGEARPDRALWWTAYVEDRHAYVLAARGRTRRALRSADRARRAWLDLGEGDLAERCASDIEALTARLAADA